MNEKKFENITVDEICRYADVRRATFYKHFADKYAFLSYFIHRLRIQFDSSKAHNIYRDASIEYYIDYARELINFFVENEKILNNVLESELAANIIAIIIEENFKDTKERLAVSVKNGLSLPASVNTVACMLTGGVAIVILAWFKNGHPVSKDELLDEISRVIKQLEK